MNLKGDGNPLTKQSLDITLILASTGFNFNTVPSELKSLQAHQTISISNVENPKM
jgi:hypothetical protein